MREGETRERFVMAAVILNIGSHRNHMFQMDVCERFGHKIRFILCAHKKKQIRWPDKNVLSMQNENENDDNLHLKFTLLHSSISTRMN